MVSSKANQVFKLLQQGNLITHEFYNTFKISKAQIIAPAKIPIYLANFGGTISIKSSEARK